MKLNLDAMRSEMQDYLDSRGFAVFYGSPRGGEQTAAVYWNTESHPDYRTFLGVAEAAGVRMVTFYSHQFQEDLIEDALERLDTSSLPREDRRSMEARLQEMRGYLGFTCQIELSFDVAPRVYVFDLHTEWFDDLNEMLDRIDEAYEEKDDDEPLGGGYFSKN